MASIEIVLFDAAKHGHLLPALVDLHIHSIEFDRTILRYHPPFDTAKREKMTRFWQERIQQVAHNGRIIFLALSRPSRSPSQPAPDRTDADEIAGMVELGMPDADTGPFRGEIEMLMVSAEYRRHGVGKKLMHELERVATDKGRTLLQLCTTVDSVAEKFFYPRLGYVKFGVVPNYGIAPVTGELVHGAYFYKDLKR